jgi:DNA-nicking Smr family endonuclease
MDKARRLSEEEAAAWAKFAGRIEPLRGRVVDASRNEAAKETKPQRRLAPLHEAPRALSIGDQPGGLDRASWQKLRGGAMRPERSLDLHGQTAERAFHSLVGFLRAAHADGLRCVEVVTGQGRMGGGVIRRELPHWLNRHDIRPLVLAAAHPHAANQGAVRLLLRRTR